MEVKTSMNEPPPEDELLAAMKNRKAGGSPGILPEMLKVIQNSEAAT